MFIFNRSLAAVAAGLAVALACVCLSQWVDEPPDAAAVVNMTRVLVREPPLAVSSAPVRDLSLSCRLPPASFASWLPSLKSRIVPDQVAACADDPTDRRSALLLVKLVSGV